MFSATLHSEEVRSTASKICQNPTLVDLKVPSTSTVELTMSIQPNVGLEYFKRVSHNVWRL